MSDAQVFEHFTGSDITDEILAEATLLFNNHYGTWSTHTSNPADRVKLSKQRMRQQLLPTGGSSCIYARVTVATQLVGNAFACRWVVDGVSICWITQLVVHSEFRRQGLAARLLREAGDSDVCGIMSSHPAACLAAARAFGDGCVTAQDLEFMHVNARAVMEASPVAYVREAVLRGKLFDGQDTSGAVSSVDTQFFVDHKEPLGVLAMVKQERDWPLGELLEGFEFLLILKKTFGSQSAS
ncbi:hypothetical protein PtrSN002B_007440 [Pyrenophora tritici-repentis]|uniref:Acetyltransf-1 domain containing protein n=1 Tax=Pyrenophora tritici-repentis TaxID=45151 RepID=A0A2W1CZG5_9PLEO|nr:hypothetical protein PtrV1_07301 [Pyrenophora tritici-repentis]KAF7448362.1 hypothetical protein A1F99_077260 [Pyrenophora tritici-repentis]KAF7572077.1 Acetyltransf-1 domain containing protein [Pyrenophora tritici-repentis]KAI0582395.1 hypothetical protein Alg215_04135 [Pyrenophora tritici-repentis]KAI0588217.1 hypothetical protein Alg130_03468 [Pyrenophora tritici-repentis]